MTKSYTLLNIENLLQKVIVEHDFKISPKDIADWYCNKLNRKPGSVWVDDCADILIKHDSAKPFVGYIAIRDVNEYDEENSNRWCITKEEFWNRYHYLDDGENILDIPNFEQCMENAYEYRHESTNKEQIKILTDLGFKVLDVKEWNND
jgi:hypothetical protein